MAGTKALPKFMFLCGIFAGLLFIGTDLLAGNLWKGYNFTSQSISELSAFDAPTRLFVLFSNFIYYSFLITFGVGIWKTAGQNRILRTTAGLILGNAVVTVITSVFFPMRLGESASINSIHVMLMMAAMLCFLLAIGFGAALFKNWFRFYSIGTLLAYLALTILGLFVFPRLARGDPVSRVGIQERVMVLGYLLWVVMLAVNLLRVEKNKLEAGFTRP
jgi:hypothetical protein